MKPANSGKKNQRGRMRAENDTTNNSAQLASVRKQRRYSAVQLHRAKGVKQWRHDVEMAKFARLSKLEGSLVATLQLERQVPSMAGAIAGTEMSIINPASVAAALGAAPGQKRGTNAASTATANVPDKRESKARLKLKSAIRKVKLTNMIKTGWLADHEDHNGMSDDQQRAQGHCKPWVGCSLVVLHFLGIFLCYMLSQQIWTYDGLDAVEMIESQILLTSSHFDHTNSRYTDVDSHWAFRQYMPILMGKLFSEGGGEFVSSRILRYSVDKEKEESCPRNLLNSSFHLAKSPNDKLDEDRQSRSYKSFRPLANKGPAFEGYKVSESAAYLSDGVILRQLRGDTWLGGFARDHEAVARCGSTRVLGADNQVFTSGVKGLYMNYPSTGGFDLFFGAETSYADVQKTLNHAFDCGWVDQKTRAVMVIFTLTFFRDVELLDNGTPNSDNITWVKDAGDAASAYGPNIDVSVKIIFEMPSNGLVRSRHELAVIDKTQNTEKQICLFMIGITSILQVGLYVSDWCSMGTRSYWSHWNNILRLVSAFLAIGSLAAYFWSSFLNTIYAFDPGKVKAEASYAQYRCTALFDVEKNAEKTSMNVFLQTFSFHALLEVWSTLNYLNVFPKIMIPITALASSAREVLSFMCVFFLIIMGFTIAAHLTFGEIYEFRSVSQTFGTLLLISVDELDSVDLFDGTQHLQFGRIFIWIVRMTTSIIFLNIFIVIVLVQYEIARSENREVLEHMHQTLLTFGIRITSGFGGVVKRCSCICCCLKDPRNAQETYTTAFRKWYHGFRSSGHSDSYPPLRHDTEVVMGELHKLANELTIIRSIVVSQDAKILKLNAQLGQH